MKILCAHEQLQSVRLMGRIHRFDIFQKLYTVHITWLLRITSLASTSTVDRWCVCCVREEETRERTFVQLQIGDKVKVWRGLNLSFKKVCCTSVEMEKTRWSSFVLDVGICGVTEIIEIWRISLEMCMLRWLQWKLWLFYWALKRSIKWSYPMSWSN